MKLKLRQKIWCLLFRSKILRYFVFYRLNRYKKKLSSLNELNIKKNGVIVDFGANNGVVSQYLSDKYSCYIHAFEPNPYCFEILKNIFRNNHKVRLYNMAISNTSKTQKLFLSNRSADITNMGLSEVSSLEKIKLNVSVKNFIKVNSITFSKVIKKLKFINFLKIDIEGHEYKIFPSIIKNINKIDKIFCEMHGENGRKDFVKEYKKWDKKLFKFQKNKFFYW